MSTFNARTDALNKYMDVGELLLPGSSQINFGLIAVSSQAPVTETQTMGSPLPSKGLTAILSLFIGLVLWGFYMSRNKPCDEEYYI